MKDGKINPEEDANGYFHEFPEEVILHIFSFLDAIDLPNVELVNHFFNNLTRDEFLWKELAKSEDPLLFKQTGNNRPHYRSLIIENLNEKYNKLKKYKELDELKSITNNLLLAALKGDIDKINESDLEINQKQALIALSVVNGHFQHYEALTHFFKSVAFKIVADVGDAKTMGELLLVLQPVATESRRRIFHICHEEDDIIVGKALISAAAKGQLTIVKQILNHLLFTGFLESKQPDDMVLAAQAAAANGHHLILDEILKVARSKISYRRNGRQHFIAQSIESLCGPDLVYSAVKNRHIDVLKLLYDCPELLISPAVQNNALGIASGNNDAAMVQEILYSKRLNKINILQIEIFLKEAVQNGNHDSAAAIIANSDEVAGSALRDFAKEGDHLAVKTLLTIAGAKIRTIDLVEAIRTADKEVQSFLLDTYGNDLSISQLCVAVGNFRAMGLYAYYKAQHITKSYPHIFISSANQGEKIEESVLVENDDHHSILSFSDSHSNNLGKRKAYHISTNGNNSHNDKDHSMKDDEKNTSNKRRHL